MQYLTSNMPLKHHPLIMRVEFHQLLSCLFFLILTNTILCSSHPNLPQKPQLEQDPTPLGYLEYMVGSRKGTYSGPNIKALKKYLSSLGYMDADYDSRFPNVDLFDDKLESALKRYQLFFKLNVTGILDSQTVSQLVGTRCGVADLVNHKSAQPHKWPKRTITYEFEPGTRPDVVRATVAALAEWGRVTGIKFQHIHSFERADIKISVLKWALDQGAAGYNFDGPGGIVTYAFAPTDGRLYYDELESWSEGVVEDAIDLQTVGLHELGHILGLGHSSDPGSIMFPSMAPGVRKGLGKNDIRAIRALYNRSKKA